MGLRPSWVLLSVVDHVAVFPQVFYTRSLLCLLEDDPPVSTTLPVRLTSRACWAPDETARLMVMHRNHNSTRLAVTTCELGARQPREGVDVVGKRPHARPSPLHRGASSTDSSGSFGALFFLLSEYSGPANVFLFAIVCTGRVAERLPHSGPSVWPWDPDTNHWPYTVSFLLTVLSQLWQRHSFWC